MDNQNQFSDLAEPILRGDPALMDHERESLWDAFHSKNAAELEQHLMPMAIPEDTKKKLWDAKKASTPPANPVTAAVEQIAQLDPVKRGLAESSPNLLKALVAAATPPDKVEPSTGAKTSPKQPAGGKATQSKPLVQPDRPDGLEHMPPIPDGHHRVKTSDGGIWDVPAEGLDAAREKDPNLHVLNP